VLVELGIGGEVSDANGTSGEAGSGDEPCTQAFSTTRAANRKNAT